MGSHIPGQPGFLPKKYHSPASWKERVFGFHFFLQHYRLPQSKIYKLKNVKEIKKEGEKAAKKVQSLEGKIAPFLSVLPIIHHPYPNGDWTGWVWNLVAQREEFTSYPPSTWLMLYFTPQQRQNYMGSSLCNGENVLLFYSV